MKLCSLQMPPTEFDHVEKGDALHGSSCPFDFLSCVFSCAVVESENLVLFSAMELALSLEKLTNEKLLKLHSVRLLSDMSMLLYIYLSIFLR